MADKLVFTTKEGDWQIYTTDRYTKIAHGQSLKSNVYAYHAECEDITPEEYGSVNCWHSLDITQRCILCRDPVPDDIQTLVFLYMMR